MFIMRDEILEILCDINEDIANYEGENLLQDGLIDSLSVIDLVSELCDRFDINISAKYIVEDNFKSIESIVRLVESLK